MKRLRPAFACLALFVFSSTNSLAINILAPGDAIFAIDVSPSASETPGSGNEEAFNVLDNNTGSKYLNFAKLRTGFIVTPATNAAVQSFRLWTGNDAEGRDPSTYELYGTNDAISSAAHSQGNNENWSLISSGDVTLPEGRGAAGEVVSFTNASAFNSYRLVFPTVKNTGGENSMQVAEVEFFSAMDGSGVDFLQASDPIIPIQFGSSVTPGAEGAENLLDGDSGTKYLNFGREQSGFIVTPQFGASTVTGIRVTTANDFVNRDPATYELYGTNEAITADPGGLGNMQNWNLISSGDLDLPDTRFLSPQLIPFANATEYSSYRVVFPTVKGASNSMQIGDFELIVDDTANLRINRATGEVFINAIGDVTFESYEVTSTLFETLNSANWTSIASTNADGNDTWAESSNLGALLAEADINGDGADDGFTLTSGNAYNLGAILPVLPTDFEDLDFELLDVNGEVIGDQVEYFGGEIPYGDYSGNGSVGIEDWPTFLAGFGGDYTGMTAVQAYLGGDLDGDLDSDIHDFNLFVESAGGLAALFGSQAPEPTSACLALGAVLAGLCTVRSRRVLTLAVTVAVGLSLCQSSAEAQTAASFTNTTGTPTATLPLGFIVEDDNVLDNLFDDNFLDDTATTIQEVLFDPVGGNYATFINPETEALFGMFAGEGNGPHTVFFDYGSSVSANYFAFAQRTGAIPVADRAGKFEFWFSDTDFSGVVPAGDPDTVVELSDTDNRLFDSIMRPYSLHGDFSGQYVAMRLTLAGVSANQGTNNLGGHEFRLLNGPGDVVFNVNRATGEITVNNESGINIDMKNYSIESASGALDAVGFNGLGGDSGAFPMGDGTASSAGWDIGGGSGATRLVEGYFSGASTLGTGVTGLSLGEAYNEFSGAEDLLAVWTTSKGQVYSARVDYFGDAPAGLLGDFNNDNVVDSIDYAVWREALGTTTVLPNDQTPGMVTQDDFNDWLANFGAVAGGAPAAAAAPEPMVLAMLSLAALCGVSARRKSHR